MVYVGYNMNRINYNERRTTKCVKLEFSTHDLTYIRDGNKIINI